MTGPSTCGDCGALGGRARRSLVSGHRGRASQDIQDSRAPSGISGRRAGRCGDVKGPAGHHRRYALSVTAHNRVTGPIVLAAFRAAVTCYGAPASTLTDNGMVFTTRLSGGKVGIGQTHARTRVLMLIQDLDVRVINAATGELLRELTINPARDYQPTGKPRYPKPKTP
jgi:hypothetical protein